VAKEYVTLNKGDEFAKFLNGMLTPDTLLLGSSSNLRLTIKKRFRKMETQYRFPHFACRLIEADYQQIVRLK
jgi:hypothetical protein